MMETSDIPREEESFVESENITEVTEIIHSISKTISQTISKRKTSSQSKQSNIPYYRPDIGKEKTVFQRVLGVKISKETEIRISQTKKNTEEDKEEIDPPPETRISSKRRYHNKYEDNIQIAYKNLPRAVVFDSN